MPKNLPELVDRLIAERGGMGAFTVKQYMIVRGLAYALARLSNGDRGDLSEIAAMEAQLPPLRKLEPPADWSLLTDDELEEYERLLSKAYGFGPSDPLPPPPKAVGITADQSAIVRFGNRPGRQ